MKVEPSATLFARGIMMRGVIADRTSPLTYGYEHAELPVYFNQTPLLNVGNLPAVTLTDGPTSSAGRGGTITPMAFPLPLSGWDPTGSGLAYGALPSVADSTPGGTAGGRGGRGGGGAGGGFGGRGGSGAAAVPGVVVDSSAKARVILAFPAKADQMLLSGTLQNGELLANRAQLVDATIGRGHVVMFAIRPFWRWQTQGTYSAWLQRAVALERLGGRTMIAHRIFALSVVVARVPCSRRNCQSLVQVGGG